jgi:hypothetical protein
MNKLKVGRWIKERGDLSSYPKTREEALEKGSPYYFKGTPCRNGHLDVRYAKGAKCVTCHREYQGGVYHSNKPLFAKIARKNRLKRGLEYERQVSKAYRRANPARHMLNRARMRSRLKGFEFNITIEDVVIPEFCPVLGLKLLIGDYRPRHPQLASLDRIDNSKGYVKGNVRVISNRANELKRDASLEEIRAIKSYVSCSRGDE